MLRIVTPLEVVPTIAGSISKAAASVKPHSLKQKLSISAWPMLPTPIRMALKPRSIPRMEAISSRSAATL